MGLFLIGPILALVFGYMARNEIDRSGGLQGGRGLAVAGIVLGWVMLGVSVILIWYFIWFFRTFDRIFEIQPFPTPF